MDIMKAFKSGQKKWKCEEVEPGVIKCNSWRQHQDGSSEELAGFEVAMDGRCTGYPQGIFENESGEFDKLEKKAWTKIRNKCKQASPEY